MKRKNIPMKVLFDFLPIVLFFIVYKLAGLYAAIYAMFLATLVQVLVGRYTTGKFEKNHLITFALLLVFGGVTLVLRDPTFIMWKVSVLYVVFALVLIVSMFVGKKTILQRLMGADLTLPKRVWNKLTWLWVFGFIGIAIVNSYYVNIASSAREKLFENTSLSSKIELSQFDCYSIVEQNLCIIAQQYEASWVNFKLFGTIGLTLILIVISVFIITKYTKKE